MNRKWKQELQNYYNAPPPIRKEAFLQRIEQRKPPTPFLVRIMPSLRFVAVCGITITCFGLYQNFKHLPAFKDKMPIDSPVHTEDTNFSETCHPSESSISTIEPEWMETDITTWEYEEEASIDISSRPTSYTTVVSDSINPESPSTGVLFIPQESDTSMHRHTTSAKDTIPVSTIQPLFTTEATRTVPVQQTDFEPMHSDGTASEDFEKPTDEGLSFQPPIDQDHTVTPSVKYTITDKVHVIWKEMEPPVDSTSSESSELLYQLKEEAEVVVIAHAQEHVYTSLQDGLWEVNPWTISNIEVELSLKGNLDSGSKVSLFTSGGYMPMKEYLRYSELDVNIGSMTQEEIEETTVHVLDVEPPVIGETYLFFLSRYPDGGYRLIEGIYYECNGVYYDVSGNFFTEEELYCAFYK